MKCPVPRLRMVLLMVCAMMLRSCYAVSGTEIAYQVVDSSGSLNAAYTAVSSRIVHLSTGHCIADP
eukprot:2992493-Rhodomonas_salina.1